MSVFYVFQGETYKIERAGGYVWSPRLTKRGSKNIGYSTMTEIQKGDFILHNSNGRIRSISVAVSDCYDSDQPDELMAANTSTDWDRRGYRVDVDYVDFDKPLAVTDHKAWLAEHYIKDSAFQINGTGKQQYMCHLADEHAIYFLEKAIESQNSTRLRLLLSGALEEVTGTSNNEYDATEIDQINELINTGDEEVPEWTGERNAQAMVQSETTKKARPKRDPATAANALKRAAYRFEFNEADRTFLRKNGKPYTEPHHLIPISKYKDFDYSVDVMENIVSLCSHCHNLLHYGRMEDKEVVLQKLYNDRIAALRACGLDLTFDQLKSYYE